MCYIDCFFFYNNISKPFEWCCLVKSSIIVVFSISFIVCHKKKFRPFSSKCNTIYNRKVHTKCKCLLVAFKFRNEYIIVKTVCKYDVHSLFIDSFALCHSMNCSLVVDPSRKEIKEKQNLQFISSTCSQWLNLITYIVAWWWSIWSIWLNWIISRLCGFCLFWIWIPKNWLHIYIHKNNLH